MPELFPYPAPGDREVTLNVNVEELARVILVELNRGNDSLFRTLLQLSTDSARTLEVLAQHCPPLQEIQAAYKERVEDYRRAYSPGLLQLLFSRGPSAAEIESMAHREAAREVLQVAQATSFLHNPQIAATLAARRDMADLFAGELLRRVEDGDERYRQAVRELLQNTLG